MNRPAAPTAGLMQRLAAIQPIDMPKAEFLARWELAHAVEEVALAFGGSIFRRTRHRTNEAA